MQFTRGIESESSATHVRTDLNLPIAHL